MIIRTLCLIASLVAAQAVAAPLGTTFTYQGELSFNDAPANGRFDFVFTLHDATDAGAQVGDAVLIDEVQVTDGVFTVEIDFGTEPFAGDQLWLEIGVREGALSDPHQLLLPRQKLTATPYALHAEMVAMDAIGSAEIADNSLTASDIASNAITSAELAPGAVQSTDVNSSQVQLRVNGACTGSDAIQTVNEDGSVACISGGGSYTDADAVAAILAADGHRSTLDADLLDGQHANQIIAAATDEVRTAISQADLPLTISRSGSYYFTSNLTHSDSNDAAIHVDADHVTIDLMGFTLTGPGKTSGLSSRGIEISDQTNVTIENGTVRDFGFIGIFENSATGRAHQMINVKVIDNGGSGIFLHGANHQVRRCTAQSNGENGLGYGIRANDGSLLLSNTAANNGGVGIFGGEGTSLINNSAFSNNQGGILGGATLVNNTAGRNGFFGIEGLPGATLLHNTGYENAGTGIVAGFGSLIANNTVHGNVKWGLYGFGGNLIERNTVYNNNQAHIVDVGGIRVGLDSRVVGNNVDSNGEHNIYVSGHDNVIERNHVTDAFATNAGLGYGIFFESDDNLYRDNTATGNVTNFGGTLPPAARDINNIGW